MVAFLKKNTGAILGEIFKYMDHSFELDFEIEDEYLFFEDVLTKSLDCEVSKWLAIHHAVRAGVFSDKIDKLVHLEQVLYRDRLKKVIPNYNGIPSGYYTSNDIKIEKIAEKEASKIGRWFPIEDVSPFYILESNVERRSEIAHVLEDLSHSASYYYFNNWKMINRDKFDGHAYFRKEISLYYDEDAFQELLVFGLVTTAEDATAVDLVHNIGFSVLREIFHSHGLKGANSYSRAISLIKEDSRLMKSVEEYVENNIDRSRLIAFNLPDESWTREQLMNFRVRAQLLVNMIILSAWGWKKYQL